MEGKKEWNNWVLYFRKYFAPGTFLYAANLIGILIFLQLICSFLLKIYQARFISICSYAFFSLFWNQYIIF